MKRRFLCLLARDGAEPERRVALLLLLAFLRLLLLLWCLERVGPCCLAWRLERLTERECFPSLLLLLAWLLARLTEREGFPSLLLLLAVEERLWRRR